MDGSASRPTQDHRVRELAQLTLTLRGDLRFTPHFEGGEKCYLIEDPVRSQFFRVGIAEYFFISMLDGSTSVGDALIRLAQVKGNHALTEQEAVAICNWLVEAELASTPESVGSERLVKSAVDRVLRKRLGAWNPLCAKIPLAYPDQFFASITPWCRYLFGLPAAIILVLLGMLAVHWVTLTWDQFSAASGGIFSPGRWIWMAVCWVVLKVVHECAHAIVCRMYGGTVPEAGAIFVLFAPLAYVDLTSSWRFRSKWRRIHTAAAGMYIELLVAVLAGLAWSATSPGTINDLCFNVIVMAGLTTLVFNANPLMRFDGYYILSDLLEIPNLYSDGQQYLQYVGRKYILGERVQSSLAWSARDIITRVYGMAAFAWRIAICCSIVIAASMLFDGLGVVLATAALVMWVGVPIVRLIKYVSRRDGLQRRRQFRLVAASTVVCLLGFFSLELGWPGAVRAPAIVQYEPLAYVRASSDGFVKEIFVQSGQLVQEGDPIAQLENAELVSELRDLEIAIEQSLLKSRVFKQDDEIHSYQAELEQLHSLQKKRSEKQSQVDQLLLRAPAEGRIVARDLLLKLDTFLKEGDELAALGDESSKELQVAIAQSDYDYFKSQMGRSVSARLSGGVLINAPLNRVDPRATKTPPHESMYANFGGSLHSRAVEADGSPETFELLTPHFSGSVTLTPSQSQALRVGQRGVVWFGRGQRTIKNLVRQQLAQLLSTDP